MNKFDKLDVREPAADYTSAVKINAIKIENYKFFYESFELPVNGKNLLLYGENGTGKSTIYDALQLLTGSDNSNLDKDLNIFAKIDSSVEVEFEFSNHLSLIVTSDLEERPDGFEFLNGLSVFSPLLDYKKLLKVHFSTELNRDNINLYYLFRELLNEYPVRDDKKLKDLSEIEDSLRELKSILSDDVLQEANRYLRDFFCSDITIIDFKQRFATDKETEKAIPTITMEVEYKNNPIQDYHTFLNEARLSALAISIYFVAIKKLLGTLKEDALKILVLDDLLISLDMSNRLKLLEILRKEFSDFQIFFFTHDLALFEMYKGKLDWASYELYLDENGDVPMPVLKRSNSWIEKAKEFFAKKEYACSAVLLRKEFEKSLKSYLPGRKQLDSSCNPLDLASLIERAISKCDKAGNTELKKILDELNGDRKHLLNPLSHDDSRQIYSEEVRRAIEDLEILKKSLP